MHSIYSVAYVGDSWPGKTVSLKKVVEFKYTKHESYKWKTMEKL